RVNNEHGTEKWQPIHYKNDSFSQAALARLYRAAHVGVVTPLRDGMNLVAKEYVATQDPEDPGVLILSKFAGAAEDFNEDEALLVDPNRAGPGCLDSAPLDLSGFLPGYAERGALRFCRCVGRA
ncbi:trehalose-6-phosphate synthase, partial [Bradyrhizobium japonicum]